ncbi:hypothetical protein [Haloechinothrix halophila]|nr:hypothetical protein [Haloechinothrix halophila]
MIPYRTYDAVMAEVDYRTARYRAEARRARLLRLAGRPRRLSLSRVK